MSTTTRRRATFAVAALTSALALAACESQGEPSSGSSVVGGGAVENAKVAFLMPDLASTRYELQDKPLFEAKMKELCPSCTVIYQNADSDASKQQQQANSALAQGAKVLVIDPVDSAGVASTVQAAQSQGAKVIAYDRPSTQAKADFYVSFDNEKIGNLIATSLVEQLKKTNAQGGILEINGSPTDAAAGLIKKGVHSSVDTSGFTLLAEYDTPNWQPAKAQEWTAGQITRFGSQIVGVVAANDGTGGGAIAAFKAAGTKVPPVTGNDAELAAAQRIISGDQFNTISKPIKIVAEAAAESAYSMLQGKAPESKATVFDTPAELFVPEVVTKENIKKVLFDSGIMKASQACTGAYAAGCTELGIK
ncbi:ABC transporter substrate-binding protein [Terracoccus luteus]|jgi:D-xylose transport system substrate-binding protein|uniref:Simple sugar transport system substrate-binding protein/D-xylose transport system substrate-binding protein n=1 Tax=Terracoccus luteus TaxID=53356 RepID=A0A839Q4H6_9MICO|nr:sugar ABC transporter substrate-binding protein [Terracoccus luteus]MBB2988062.1 simple sugar transport system substrate-binding protein/D-xylose transport system substrate-binding protein [Terracoccus luteus]MCP2173713.1 simple sugar transport system substrate-binding protein/D-xylose transport system substrate-binding protein [Terracoccus luteus]